MDLYRRTQCSEKCQAKRLINALCDVLIARGVIRSDELMTAYDMCGEGVYAAERVEVLKDLIATNK
ncbi:MAG: hypothetical protein QHG98_07220 [Methanothrix sp.]|nr:hypothetical protein [Methanothrix sp.]